jgi:hypothetical protein
MEKKEKKAETPIYAAGFEQDALKEDATEAEIARGESTLVSSLILDRTGDDER